MNHTPKSETGAGLASLLDHPVYAIPLVVLAILFALLYLHDVRSSKEDDQ